MVRKTILTNKPGPELRIRLRSDLNRWLQKCGRSPYYLIEDPISDRYFRLGMREWKLASLLDGDTTLAEALAKLRQEQTEPCLSDAEAVAFCRWLVSVQLATVQSQSSSGSPVPVARGPGKVSKAAVLTNPFFIRIPLLNPDPYLKALLPWLDWTLGRFFFVAWLVLCTTGAYQVFSQWDRFMDAASAVLAPQNWIYLLVAWVLLKVVHETFHGLVCKKFGGTVPSGGIVLILFSPVAFVDVTSSWRFSSKWQRIFTAAAGMYVEFAIASAAAILWSQTAAGVVNNICHSVVLMASVTTLLFNANPLMRFDGYYIFTDLVEIQNLYPSGRQYMRYFFRRYFLGVGSTLPTWPRGKRTLIMVYAWASCFWRLMVCVSMAAVAATLFHGAGLVLTALAVVIWFALPVVRFVRYLFVGDGGELPQRWRFVLVSGCCAGAAVGLMCLPWPGGVGAPGVVEYKPLEVIRTSGAGFVREIRVRPGEKVQAGQILAVLVNEETQRELEDLQLAIEQSLIKGRVLHRGEDMAQYQVEIENRLALVMRQKQLQQQVSEMQAQAPRAGRVIGRELDALIGQYLQPGTSLMAIGEERSKEIRLSIPEDYVETFMGSVGTYPHLRVRGRSEAIRRGRLVKIEPKASVKLVYPALAAPAGGPLAVRAVAQSGHEHQPAESAFEFVSPRFTGIVDLPSDMANALRAGELVQARLFDGENTIGRRVYQIVGRWLEKKLKRGNPAS
jgi:putative peptide zinc metalloprotease protein